MSIPISISSNPKPPVRQSSRERRYPTPRPSDETVGPLAPPSPRRPNHIYSRLVPAAAACPGACSVGRLPNHNPFGARHSTPIYFRIYDLMIFTLDDSCFTDTTFYSWMISLYSSVLCVVDDRGAPLGTRGALVDTLSLLRRYGGEASLTA